MKIFKIILMAFIVVISSYIVSRLLYKRSIILKQEGFSVSSVFSTPEGELLSLTNKPDLTNKIQNANSNITNMPLCQYCIKGSYNSAMTGNNMNVDMIKYVINRGCRFIDFEVYLIDNVPTVAYSVDPLYAIIETANNILLDTVFTTAITTAFSGKCPNKSDPLFIQLRVKSNDPAIFPAIAMSVDAALATRLYDETITPSTLLSDVMGKVVLIIDTSSSPGWKKYDICNTASPSPTGTISGNVKVSTKLNANSIANAYIKQASLTTSTPNSVDNLLAANEESILVTPKPFSLSDMNDVLTKYNRPTVNGKT